MNPFKQYLQDVASLLIIFSVCRSNLKSYIIQTICLPLCSPRNHTHHTTLGLGAIIGNSLQKSTNFMIVISFSACPIKTCIDWQFSICMYCILHFYIVSLMLSCILSTQNKRILYCIVGIWIMCVQQQLRKRPVVTSPTSPAWGRWMMPFVDFIFSRRTVLLA